ncbi:MAG: hypothetical protein VR64_18625 [Desulfatitalea sp. BRH_c12]|nr:MAG: hypothetical protein VR64_18625 [Desulfatitalea sp. BRH_c12]
MKNWKAGVPILLALVIAVAGSLFIYNWIGRQTAPSKVVQVDNVEAVPVVVAAVDLAWGTQITPEMLRMASFLKESLPNGHFSTPADLKDRVLIANLKQGEAIVEHRLAPKDITTGGVSAILPTGKRALSVKGDKVIGISGFINPGNRVDVLVTLPDETTKQDVTKIVLENIPVLATGTQIERNAKGEPAPVDVYTLEMTPEESEKLALAAAKGKLQFALRNILDLEKVNTQGATIAQTLNMAAPKRPVTRWVAPSSTVEVIRGSAMTRQKM